VSRPSSRPPGHGRSAPSEDDDTGLFEAEMRGVRPLPGKRPAPPPEAGRQPGKPAAAGTPAARPPVKPTAAFNPLPGGGYVAAGVSPTQVRELRAGRPAVEASLDLHGQRAAAAEQRLHAFIRSARQARRRLLLVIHGRGHGSGPGGPVLRDLVIEQLTRPPLAADVLAAVSAPPTLGGDGATLVWLRQR
jgi:DNA-nicking Smr family endonuclease